MSYALKNDVMSHLLTALEYIDNAHYLIAKAVKDEKKLSYTERNELYDYGLSDIQIHKVKLSNMKKAILSITGNIRFRQLKRTRI